MNNEMIKALRDSQLELEAMLENAPMAVMLMDGERKIRKANGAAAGLAGRSRQEMAGLRSGEALRCIHSTDCPEGCGFGPSCGNCMVRNAVLDTFATGTPRRQVEAAVTFGHMGAPLDFTFLVSTSLIPFQEETLCLVCMEDITARKRIEKELKESLREKETLLKELYHRTKNNMNVMSMLMHLQAGAIEDPAVRQLFKEARGRIQSMALAQELLYKTEALSRLDLKEYLEKLAPSVVGSYKAAKISLKLDMEPVSVALDVAMPCGLIINELLSNSLKYAFPAGEGELRISLRARGNELELACLDNGIGFPEDFQMQQASSLGLRLVSGLANQLAGRLEIVNGKGAAGIIIRFDISSLQ